MLAKKGPEPGRKKETAKNKGPAVFSASGSKTAAALLLTRFKS